MKVLYKCLKKDELDDLKKIDRRQLITKKYILDKDKLILKEENIMIDGWNQVDLLNYTKKIKDIYNAGGILYGAYINKDILVGVIAIDIRYLDSNNEYINLDLLYISSEYRHRGIGTTLVKKAIKESKRTGAKYLYISSSNFKETVDFYLKLGAEIITPLGKMFEIEPEDIHMRINLNK